MPAFPESPGIWRVRPVLPGPPGQLTPRGLRSGSSQGGSEPPQRTSEGPAFEPGTFLPPCGRGSVDLPSEPGPRVPPVPTQMLGEAPERGSEVSGRTLPLRARRSGRGSAQVSPGHQGPWRASREHPARSRLPEGGSLMVTGTRSSVRPGSGWAAGSRAQPGTLQTQDGPRSLRGIWRKRDLVAGPLDLRSSVREVHRWPCQAAVD